MVKMDTAAMLEHANRKAEQAYEERKVTLAAKAAEEAAAARKEASKQALVQAVRDRGKHLDRSGLEIPPKLLSAT